MSGRDDAAERVRAELFATPGARLCPLCAVITQGGPEGQAAHQLVVHGLTGRWPT